MFSQSSLEEAGRYLETYKAYEHKSADMIKERVNNHYMAQLTELLTTVQFINKTDVITLIENFGVRSKKEHS
jgi:DNA excision repair protein ERCC-1